MGVKIMHPGDMLFIPKGIGHRSMLCEDSTDDNVLIELKIADELTYVGRRQEVRRKRANCRSRHRRHRLADHRRFRPPHHPRCGDRRAGRQDRGGRQVGGDRQEPIPARKPSDGRNTVATPGFVDCHLHSSFQLSRGLADEANAQSFLFDRMYPYEAALDADDVRVSATLAATELLKHGVTCFIDPGNYHPESSVEGVMSTGIRMIVSRSSFDLTKSVLGLLPERMIENTATALERAEAVLRKIRQVRQPAARRQRLVPRPQQRLRRIDRRPRQARQEIRHAAADPRLLLLFDPRFQHRPRRPRRDRAAGQARRARRAHAGGALRLARAAGGGDAGQAQAFAGLRAVIEPAQRLRQFRRRQTAGADGARRQRRDRLRPRLLRHRRHDAGGAARLLLLQGDAAQPARHAAGDRHRDGDDQRRQGRADGRPHRLASRSARRPTSCCSTPSARNGSR